MRISILSLLLLFIVISCTNTTTDSKITTSDTVVVTTEKQLLELNEKIKKQPSNPTLYHQRAQYYVSIRDFNAALQDMSSVMNLDSTKVEYLITLSDLYMFANRTSESKKYLEKIIRVDPKNTEAMLKLAELYLYVKKHQESIDYVNKALQIDDQIAKGYFIKGMNYFEIGDTAKGISSIITATEQDPEYYSAYMMLGVISAKQKNKAAIGYYDNALRINPTSTEAKYNKGKLYQDIGQWDKAIDEYKSLLVIDSTYSTALYNLGAINMVGKNNNAEAINYFNKTIYFNPKYVEAYFARGLCYKNLKNKNKAIADLKMATQLNPEYAPAKEALNTMMSN